MWIYGNSKVAALSATDDCFYATRVGDDALRRSRAQRFFCYESYPLWQPSMRCTVQLLHIEWDELCRVLLLRAVVSLRVFSETGNMSGLLSSQNADCSITTDDDDDSDQKSGNSYKERRREAHTQAEQKRRDAIKKGYEDLQLLVPTCTQQDSVSSYKLSKAAILQRSIEYIQTLQQQKHKREKELQLLRKEVKGLEIMKHNYEEMVKHHQQSQQQQNFLNYNAQMISDENKFEVFKAICDSLFHSFDSSVQVGNFNELSACTIVWLEEHCKPHNLKQMMMEIMEQLQNQLK